MPSRSRRSAEAERGTIAVAIAQHPREFVGLLTGALAVLVIFVNALFLQHGPHPAPIFATRPWAPPRTSVVLPQPKPLSAQHHQASAVPQAVPVAPARSEAQLTYDIQRELARRGFYDGAVDGIWGAKTDAAARGFVAAAGLTVDPQPSENLLHAIAASSTQAGASRDAAPSPAPEDAIAAATAPSKRTLAVQRALADFGYGQIRPTGVVDSDTQAAIEKFQRDRGLPVDGRMSDRFVRELAAMTGRPLE